MIQRKKVTLAKSFALLSLSDHSHLTTGLVGFIQNQEKIGVFNIILM